MLLSKIHIANFKRYDAFTIHARKSNILVGPNNSGKSTILDTLRLLNACLNTAKSRSPRIFSLPDEGVVAGYELTLSQLPIQIANVTKDYSSDDAVIDYTNRNGARIRLCLNPDQAPRFYLLHEGGMPRTSRDFLAAFPCPMTVIPDLSPFEADENRVMDETVRKNRSTRLAARNFRNIWYRSTTAEFDEFQRLVEASWPGVSIARPEWEGFDEPVTMFFSEHRIDREIYWSGYGFQIWLQILTHILRMPPDSILVMDEPDVYLHADLQKRLLKIIDGRFSQYFIATHSTEIINEADIGSILSINPERRSARRISGDDEYQALYNYIGSAENAELAKLSRAKRVVFFEGADRKILKKFADRLGKTRFSKDTETLVIAAGGFGQWRKVADTAWALREVLKIEAKIIAIFDRDYRTTREMDQIAAGMAKNDIEFRFWDRKEIENYALETSSLVRLIQKRGREKDLSFTSSQIEEELMVLTAPYWDHVREQRDRDSAAFGKRSKSDADTEAERSADEKLWQTLQGRFALVPGKTVVSDLCGHYKEHYGISLSLYAMIDELRAAEVAPVMESVLTALDEFCHDEVTAALETLAFLEAGR